jgi:hypothetical protein
MECADSSSCQDGQKKLGLDFEAQESENWEVQLADEPKHQTHSHWTWEDHACEECGFLTIHIDSMGRLRTTCVFFVVFFTLKTE